MTRGQRAGSSDRWVRSGKVYRVRGLGIGLQPDQPTGVHWYWTDADDPGPTCHF